MRAAACLALALLAPGPPALAQAAPEGADAADSQARRRLVADNLPLEPAEAKAFWPLYAHFERDLAALVQRRRGILNRLGEHYDDMGEAVARQITLEYLDYQEARVKLMKAYFPKFEKVLPARKLARFYQIEARIRAAIDAEIAERVPLIK
jgi:hypothetical protein